MKGGALVVMGILGLGTVTSGRADILHVYQGDSIQAAVNLAATGDEIVVHAGTYNELIDLCGKAVWLRSADGPLVTVINGKQSGTIFTCAGQEGPDTIIEGFTITGGQGQPNGGGMYVYSSGPTLRTCVFRENQADYGGGIFVHFGNPVLVECAFADNIANESGGGMYSYNHPGQPSATLQDCAFDENRALKVGGGIRNWDSRPSLQRCRFEGNHVRYGGAAVADGGVGSATFSDCTFVGNRADTLFTSWECYGGAMMCSEGSSPLLVNCMFLANSAVAMLPALSHGGALASLGDARPTLLNCTLVGNHANLGNAFYNADDSHPTVRSSILWDGGDEICNDDYATITISYSAVQGYWPGAGNMADNPRLSDHHLLPDSPCINAGDPDYDPPGGKDLDGHARVLCNRVDMGTYEFGIGDYDCDRDVDSDDFVAGTACMTGPDAGPYAPGCAALDFEYDFDVDLTDYAEMQRLFD